MFGVPGETAGKNASLGWKQPVHGERQRAVEFGQSGRRQVSAYHLGYQRMRRPVFAIDLYQELSCNQFVTQGGGLEPGQVTHVGHQLGRASETAYGHDRQQRSKLVRETLQTAGRWSP